MKCQQLSVQSFSVAKNSPATEKTRLVEMRFTSFLVEHNLSLATADPLNIIKEGFRDFSVELGCSWYHIKNFCVLNVAIIQDLKDNLVYDKVRFV